MLRRLCIAFTSSALALAIVAPAFPASAATAGFHAAWVAQSAYATASAGQVVQMSAVYQNTGDQPWIKGIGAQQANFGAGSNKDPLYPRDTNAYANQGWNSGQGWLTSNRFAGQSNDLVSTGQLGSWVWTAKVPNGLPAGDYLFHGTPVVDGVTWLEDYGFFLKVTVVLGPVIITSTTPVSPTTNPTPVVNGTGAGGACTITIYDSGVSLATGTSDASGNFSIPVGPLSVGTHALSASADCAGTFKGSGGTFGYTVLAGPPPGQAVALNVREIQFNFGQCVLPSASPGVFNTAGTNDATNLANWSIDSGGVAISRATMDSGNQSVTLLTVSPMANPSGHIVSVSNVAPCSGTVIDPQLVAVTVNDTTGPTLASATASAVSGGTTTDVVIKWNEPVGPNTTACSGTYAIDGITATNNGHPDTSPTGQRQCALVSASALSAGTSHTVTVVNEVDQGGNAQTPNPSSITLGVTTIPGLAISSAVAAGEALIRLTWNQTIAAYGTATCMSPTSVAIACSNGAPATSNTSQSDVTLTTPWSVGGCNGVSQTTCAITVSMNGATGPAGVPTMSPVTQVRTVTIFKDTTKPTMTGVAQVGTTQDTWDVTWSEPITNDPSACAATTCPFRIKSGTTVIASTKAGEGSTADLTLSSPAANKSRLTASAPLPGGSYTLEAGAGVVADTSLAANANNLATIAMAVVDSTAPTVVITINGTDCTAGNQCKSFTFTYSEPMAISGTYSVLSISNYRLNGVTLTGTTGSVAVDVTHTIVTLTLISNAPAGANQLAVGNVRDQSNANYVSPNPTTFGFTRTP